MLANVSEFVSGKTLPSISTFPRELVVEWLQKAKVLILITQSHLDRKHAAPPPFKERRSIMGALHSLNMIHQRIGQNLINFTSGGKIMSKEKLSIRSCKKMPRMEDQIPEELLEHAGVLLWYH